MPPSIAIFDLETNGLLDEVTKVHILGIKDLQTGKKAAFTSMEVGLMVLDTYDLIVGHNAIRFDMPVLAKLHGYTRPWASVQDTMVLARLIWTDIKEFDLKQWKAGKFPGQLIGGHSLEAWGHRLDCHKGDYSGDPAIVDDRERKRRKWESWNQAMEDYCLQDLETTFALWQRIQAKEYSQEAIQLETQVAHICARQERFGFLFDLEKAAPLYATLVKRKTEIELSLQKVFTPRLLRDGKVFTPKRDNKKQGYTAEAEFQKLKLVSFNPGSRVHVALWLVMMRGWKPTEFTPDGSVKVDETILAQLKYPEAKPLLEFFMVNKRIGQLAEGDEAWLKRLGKDGRMHGSINTVGAVTGRMTHAHPNMGQVPASYSPYGHECRELFTVPAGKVLVGADADALELRDLAGYMSFYDKGDYIRTVLEGDKSIGTDMHSVNARALGLDPKALVFGKETGRDVAKTWFLWKSMGTSPSNRVNKNCVNSGNS